MVKLSELKAAAEVRAGDMQDLAYRREYERTRLANDLAIKVLQYRHDHGLSQTELASLLGMRQPNIARLEGGDHSPSLETLSRLADVLKLDFSIEVKPGRLRLRSPARARAASVTAIGGRKMKAQKGAKSAGRRVVPAVAASNIARSGARKDLNSAAGKSASPSAKAK
jgi:transcriptional regulator with XRE-family HTH domain